jgi:antitoxin component YwqK of YwqJK toxin-antitoxin module
MKLTYCIIIFLLTNTLCFSQKSYHISKTKDKRGTLVHKLTKKPITGIVYDTYDGGQHRSEASYNDGMLNGNFKTWYDNGQTSSECNYRNGELHGKFTFWNDAGQLLQEFNYFNGEKDGLNREWFSNGQLQTEESFENFLKDGTFKKWNESGQLIKEDFYNDGMLTGDCKEWFDNGLLKWSANFDADTIAGKIHGWYEDGQIKYQMDNWHVKMWHNNGQMFYERIPPIIAEDKATIKYWDESGKEIENPETDVFYREASFPGGMESMFQWIAQNYEYPEFAREMNLQGRIYLKFGVRYDGTVFGVEILEPMTPSCHECDEEALHLLRKMPLWIPETKNGFEEISYFVLPISLTLGW